MDFMSLFGASEFDDLDFNPTTSYRSYTLHDYTGLIYGRTTTPGTVDLDFGYPYASVAGSTPPKYSGHLDSCGNS